jgi:hypothetical protein
MTRTCVYCGAASGGRVRLTRDFGPGFVERWECKDRAGCLERTGAVPKERAAQ